MIMETMHRDFEPATGAAQDALERCQRVVDDFVVELGNLGALVALDVKGVGRITFTSGHSDIERSRAVQRDDIFPIGSQSKTITAMVLVLLERDGLVELDAPVHHYVDLPIDRRITVRHLLMNSCGLGEYTVGLFAARPDPRRILAPRDLVALALPQGQIFTPGERFDYCNTGWVIAAMIIEAVCGKSYGIVAGERIAAPLGLKSTGFGGTVPTGEMMRSYMSLPDEPLPVDMSCELSGGFGAGDGIASASDILAIYRSLIDDKSPIGISLQQLIEQTAKPGPNPYVSMSIGTEYGLGVERRAWAGREVWGHPGSTGACRTSTWLDPGLGVAVTTAVTAHLTQLTGDELRYPRAQLFAVALGTAYALAAK